MSPQPQRLPLKMALSARHGHLEVSLLMERQRSSLAKPWLLGITGGWGSEGTHQGKKRRMAANAPLQKGEQLRVFPAHHSDTITPTSVIP